LAGDKRQVGLVAAATDLDQNAKKVQICRRPVAEVPEISLETDEVSKNMANLFLM